MYVDRPGYGLNRFGDACRQSAHFLVNFLHARIDTARD
jgi:hypothetical protein